VGGQRRRSWTSVANSGDRLLTTYSNRVFWVVMPLVVNWASTWTNQTSGSAGQKGGSLILTAATVEGVAAGGTTAGVSPEPSVAIFEVERAELHQGHQCCRCATNGCYDSYDYSSQNYCIENLQLLIYTTKFSEVIEDAGACVTLRDESVV
jgi:hypothetical protein